MDLALPAQGEAAGHGALLPSCGLLRRITLAITRGRAVLSAAVAWLLCHVRKHALTPFLCEQMPPPNVSVISRGYKEALRALQAVTKTGLEAIKGFVTAFLAGLDGGLVGEVIAWVVGKVIDSFVDLEAKALAIVLRCEYIMRAGRVNFSNARKAYNLTNKCSICKCIGHNKTNHTKEIDSFLLQNQLKDMAKDATELVDAVEEDGWWEWLTSE